MAGSLLRQCGDSLSWELCAWKVHLGRFVLERFIWKKKAPRTINSPPGDTSLQRCKSPKIQVWEDTTLPRYKSPTTWVVRRQDKTQMRKFTSQT